MIMKIAGKKLSDPNIVTIVIPRENGEDIVFKAQAILDMDEFLKLCPEPVPPKKVIKGGQKVEDVESPVYKARVNDHNRQRMNYIIIKSLQATENLEWETITLSDPSTWGNYEKEFKESGFSGIEVMRIVNAAITANCLNEDRVEEARKRFLLSQEVQTNQSSSLQEEQLSTQSGEPVSG